MRGFKCIWNVFKLSGKIVGFDTARQWVHEIFNIHCT